MNDLNNTPWLVAYFSHDECNVCKTLRPKVREMLNTYPEVVFRYINIKEEPETGGQHLVFAVPTIVVFHLGKEIKRFSRYVSLGEMEDFLRKVF